MSALTVQEIVSRYLSNSATLPPNLDSESFIRGKNEVGDAAIVDANTYMTSGAGRFATVARFNFVRRFLEKDDYNSVTLSPGEYLPFGWALHQERTVPKKCLNKTRLAVGSDR